MTTREDLSTLTPDEIETVEKLTLRWVFQATLDFGMEAHEIFLKSPDDVKDIAEDITNVPVVNADQTEAWRKGC